MKNKLAITTSVAALACAGLLLAPAAAHAAPSRPGPDGPAAGGPTAASAMEGHASIPDGDGLSLFSTAHPGGGTWNYGVRGFIIKTTYSDFHHSTRKHGSSVSNGNGTTGNSGIKKAKQWAKSSVHHTFIGNEAHYRFG